MNLGNSRPRVVVTGVGMVTPLGLDTDSTWAALLAGKSGMKRISRFDPTGFPVTFAAEVPTEQLWGEANLNPGSEELKLLLTRLTVREALAASGLEGGPGVGVHVGSESARPSLELLARRSRTGELPAPRELADAAPWAPSEEIARLADARGPRSTVSTACTSSAQAVGEAYHHIRRGQVHAAIAGGVDLLVDPLMVTGFSLLGALSTRNAEPTRASRPFDRDRDGFVLGEGAGFLILEELEHARARGAEILGEILGYGTSLNAWRITDSPPDGRGAAAAMRNALDDAGLNPDQIDYINAHGTSTAQNDLSESNAIRRVFADRLPAVSSTKSMMGHLVAACGAVEAIVCLLALRDGVLPESLNLDNPDPACPLDFVRDGARRGQFRYALSNAFGFGGSNASLILGPRP